MSERSGKTGIGVKRESIFWIYISSLCVSILAFVPVRADESPAAPAVRIASASQLVFKQRGGFNTSANSCVQCHRGADAMFSHPVNVIPSMHVPDTLPLQGGRLTCVTCHERADEATHATAMTMGDSKMLRGGRQGLSFCTQCHTDGRAGNHPLVSQFAHSPSFSSRSRTGEATWNIAGGASHDPVTRDCMSCHDGAMGPDIGHSHPVGIAYELTPFTGRFKRRRSFRLTPRSSLDHRIRLINDQVSCASCHDPYAGRANMLVMENKRSQLCTSCHQRQ